MKVSLEAEKQNQRGPTVEHSKGLVSGLENVLRRRLRKAYREGGTLQTLFTTYDGPEPYVFVCYAHDDVEVVYP